MALTPARVVLVIVTIVTVWWLRDPAWVAAYQHGVHGDGWTGGRASVFVPSHEDTVSFDVAGHSAFTTQVSFFIDGRLADRFTLGDDWRTITLPTGQFETSRRHRRIDIHVARTWGPDRKGIRLRPHIRPA